VTKVPPPAAAHPYLQAGLLVVAALVVWKLAGVLLLLFSAILLAAALSAMSDGLRRLAPLSKPVGVLLAALLIFGVLVGVIALFGWANPGPVSRDRGQGPDAA